MAATRLSGETSAYCKPGHRYTDTHTLTGTHINYNRVTYTHTHTAAL